MAVSVITAGLQGPAGPPTLTPGAIITAEGQIIVAGPDGTPSAIGSQRFYVDAYGAVAQATPTNGNASANVTAINQAMTTAAQIPGGTLVFTGKYAINSTIVWKEGVGAEFEVPGVDKGSAAANLGSGLYWTAAAAGTMVKVGDKDQTVSVRNVRIQGMTLDGGDRTDVTALSLGSNTRTSAVYVTTGITFYNLLITRCGIAIQWGSGQTSEQVDDVHFLKFEINHCHTAGLIVNGGNCGDFSSMTQGRFITCTDTAASPYVDLVNCGALEFHNVFAGGEGTATKDFVKVTAHNGVTLHKCQSEKMRWFLRHLYNSDVEAVELHRCVLDDGVTLEGTGARVVSYGSEIKDLIDVSGAGAKWEGFGDVISSSAGGRVSVTGSNAVFFNRRSKRATVNEVYGTGEEMIEGATTGIGAKTKDYVARGGRKAAAWAAATAYSTAVERSWAPSTAYSVNDLVTPSWGNGVRYKCTVAGTSGTTEPAFDRLATSATYTDGTVTWVHDGNASTSVSNTIYREPTTPNGHVYKVVTAGTSGGSEPTWPTTTGATVTDGTVTWQETGVSALLRSMMQIFGAPGSAAPTSGFHYRGELTINNGPDAGEPWAWLNTLDGTPGTQLPVGLTPRARVVTSGPVTLAINDLILLCRISAPLAVTLPSSAVDGTVYEVIDDNGTAATQNITVSPASGNINGAGTYVINKNYGGARFVRGDGRWTVPQ